MRSSLFSVLSALVLAVDATPTLSYPFNSQAPPVARYGTAFNYQIPSDTFTGDNLSYSTQNLPDWLQFDAATCTLSGNPPNDGPDSTQTFELIAQDGTGASATSICTLQLTNASAPTTTDSLVSQLETAGPVAGTNRLVLKPGQQFSLSFPQDFYQSSISKPIAYYALTQDHTPLPIWLSFNPEKVEFSGTAPTVNSQVAPAQLFGIALIGTDFPGFAGAQTVFDLVVGARQFTSNVTSDAINATAGKQFTYQIPFDRMAIDGTPVQMSNISSIELNSTSWISVDNSTGQISGTPPKGIDGAQPFQVVINDDFGDSVEYILNVNVASTNSSMFTSGTLGAVNATQGQFFTFSLKDVLLDSSAQVSASYNPPASWLRFDSSNNSFVGQVPDSFSKSVVTLTAEDGGRSEESTFTLTGVKAAAVKHSSTATTATATASSTATGAAATTASAKSTPGHHNKHIVAIVCGTVIPVVAIAILIMVFFCCCRNRRRQDQKSTRAISPPIMPDPEKHLHPMHSPSETVVPPMSGGKLPLNGWDSPQKILAMNFMKMDGSGDDVNYYSAGESTHVGSIGTPSTHDDDATVPSTPAGFKSPVLVQHPEPAVLAAAATAATTNKARHSWRQPDKKGRWQEHKSENSVATISTDELLTMRLVDRQSTDSQNLKDGAHDSYMSPTKSRVLSASLDVIPRDDTSGNVQVIGSHSSSLNQLAREALARDQAMIDSYYGTSLHSVHEEEEEDISHEDAAYYRSAMNFSQTTFTSGSDNDDLGGEHYRTASSGSEFESQSEHEDSLRPYRNSRGETTWSEVELAQLQSQGIHTPQNQGRFSFVPHSGMTGQTTIDTSRRSSSVRNTLRIGEVAGRRSTPQTPELEDGPPNNASPRIPHSSSAEFAFL